MEEGVTIRHPDGSTEGHWGKNGKWYVCVHPKDFVRCNWCQVIVKDEPPKESKS